MIPKAPRPYFFFRRVTIIASVRGLFRVLNPRVG
jgi:hypothetical protein